MNAPATIPLDKMVPRDPFSSTNLQSRQTVAIDDITTFLPGCAGEEYEARARLRGYRNAASAMIASTESNDARRLAWMAAETITPLLFCPGLATADLVEVGRFAKRLMLTAMQAEDLRDGGLIP